MAATMTARWGENDCIQFLCKGHRPDWLAGCETEMDAVREAVKRHGTLLKAFEAEAVSAGMKRVKGGLRNALPGDRVVGKDRQRGRVAGIVQGDYTCAVRTASGVSVANWLTVNSVWRPREY